MSQIIWLDEDGNELKREKKGRGRPPKGSVKRDDGNIYVSPGSQEDRFVPKYITLDNNGEVIEEAAKGRGRPKPGFEKMDTGDYQGHWVKREADEA